MNFNDVLEMGVACDLLTVSEAMLNFELHAPQLLCYEELDDVLKCVNEEYAAYKAAGGSDAIPQAIIDKVAKEMQAMEPPLPVSGPVDVVF